MGDCGAVPRISEAYLEPVLVTVLAQFRFIIHGFHSDNGSEFINQTIARLLNKLMIEQTKSRPRHSNDNGLGLFHFSSCIFISSDDADQFRN